MSGLAFAVAFVAVAFFAVAGAGAGVSTSGFFTARFFVAGAASTTAGLATGLAGLATGFFAGGSGFAARALAPLGPLLEDALLPVARVSTLGFFTLPATLRCAAPDFRFVVDIASCCS
jgi:hypothetical protein